MRSLIALLAVFSAVWGLASCGSDDNTSATNATPSGNASPQNVPANTVVVNIPQGAMNLGSAAFGQNPLVIPVGTTVSWVNQDTVAHNVTENTGQWKSDTINPGQSFAHTFNQVGTFSYFCSIHPTMTGTIEVQAAASPTPTPTPTATSSATPAPTPTATTGSQTGVKVKYSDVSAILKSNCVRCHGADFATYATTSQLVTPGNPSTSTLYNQVSSGHGGLSSGQMKVISDWITAGAPNN